MSKYLHRLGTKSRFLGRAPTSLKRRSSGASEKSIEEWSYFDQIDYFKEPLVQNFLSNTSEFRNASRDCQIIHVNRANPYTASVVASSKSAGRKLVVDIEDWDGFGGYSSYSSKYGASGGLLTIYEDIFPRTSDAVLVVSRLLRKRMLKSGIPEARIHLVPNGFDPELFDPSISGAGVRKELGLGDSPVVIYASTFWDFEKALHETALASFNEIAKSVPNVRFLIVGSGNMKMKDLLGKYGLGNKIVATGFVPRMLVPRLMAAADVALHVISDHPFHAASSPMIIPEYMAMGKPIVAPRIGELEVMLRGGAGYLVSRADPRLLAEGVIRLLADENLRHKLGQRAAQSAAESYSYDVLARNMQSTYAKILE